MKFVTPLWIFVTPLWNFHNAVNKILRKKIFFPFFFKFYTFCPKVLFSTKINGATRRLYQNSEFPTSFDAERMHLPLFRSWCKKSTICSKIIFVNNYFSQWVFYHFFAERMPVQTFFKFFLNYIHDCESIRPTTIKSYQRQFMVRNLIYYDNRSNLLLCE